MNAYGDRGEFCRFTLQFANVIVCQTKWQHDALRERFQRDSICVPNPIDTQNWRVASRDAESGEYALWVGRYDRFHKRPLLCLQLANRCKDIPFVMIVDRRDDDVERQIRADVPNNVRLIDYVPFDKMPEIFAKARLFVSTGSAEYEGFPNVFLQAATSGVPIVSLEDFDGFLTRSKSGLDAGGDLDLLSQQTLELWNARDEYLSRSDAGQSYVSEYHDLSIVAEKFSQLIHQQLACENSGKSETR